MDKPHLPTSPLLFLLHPGRLMAGKTYSHHPWKERKSWSEPNLHDYVQNVNLHGCTWSHKKTRCYKTSFYRYLQVIIWFMDHHKQWWKTPPAILVAYHWGLGCFLISLPFIHEKNQEWAFIKSSVKLYQKLIQKFWIPGTFLCISI